MECLLQIRQFTFLKLPRPYVIINIIVYSWYGGLCMLRVTNLVIELSDLDHKAASLYQCPVLKETSKMPI